VDRLLRRRCQRIAEGADSSYVVLAGFDYRSQAAEPQRLANALRTTRSTFIDPDNSVNSVQSLMHLEGIDHVAMGVRDVERSAQWYIEVLGFERLHEGMWNDVPTFIGKGNTGIALFPTRPDAKPKPSGHRNVRMLHLAFRANRENFLAAQRELEKREIKFEFEDHEIAHSIYFSDPDGHQLEITTYELPQPP
jgi:catechol 2,3-dioxygenase-like lactoylglutathione lyase family enzyme